LMGGHGFETSHFHIVTIDLIVFYPATL
jgi:hypothetical protein